MIAKARLEAAVIGTVLAPLVVASAAPDLGELRERESLGLRHEEEDGGAADVGDEAVAHEHGVHPVLGLQRGERLERGEGREIPFVKWTIGNRNRPHFLSSFVFHSPEEQRRGRADALDARRKDLSVHRVDNRADSDSVGERPGHAREWKGQLGYPDQGRVTGVLKGKVVLNYKL